MKIKYEASNFTVFFKGFYFFSQNQVPKLGVWLIYMYEWEAGTERNHARNCGWFWPAL